MSLHVCHGAILSTDFEECSSALSFPGSLITFHLYSFMAHHFQIHLLGSKK